jgi:dihydroorotase
MSSPGAGDTRALTLRRPDDWHLHLRDGEPMRSILPFTCARFARAIVMPNLAPPVTTTQLALDYQRRIRSCLPAGSAFEPLMTLYLTDRTDPDEVSRARGSGCVHGFKLYPAGATTHSDSAVTDVRHIDAVLERMSEERMVLQVHGEVTDAATDIFDREARFIDRVLEPLSRRHPRLRIVLEHITTRYAVEFVRGARQGVGATITAHHLLLNRNALFAGGVRPHHFCYPVLKRETDREALVAAAVSGDPRFFLGTDSAPHAQRAKESACGCAGVFSAHAALELYAEVFDAANRLEALQGFASQFGADFYGLPRNTDEITLVREPWRVPESYPFGSERLVPLRAGEPVGWRVLA